MSREVNSTWTASRSGGHPYHWSIEFGGQRKPAFLTYDLVHRPDRYRRVLAIEALHSDHIRNWLTGNLYDGVRHLEELIQQKRAAGLGRSGAAKALAQEIYTGRCLLPDVDVAVHRFGAVPIYLIPDVTVTVDVLGQSRNCRVGIFVSATDPDTEPEPSAGPVNDLELLRSLRFIRPDLTFTRYMEDVGEYAHDLMTRGNWRKVFEAGKKMEDSLSGSVGSKIGTVLRYARSKRRPRTPIHHEARVEATQLIEAYGGLLWKFSTARILHLLFLNHLYRAVGMKDRCDDYQRQYETDWDRFFAAIEQRDALRDNDPELACLHAVWSAWNSTEPVAKLAQVPEEFPSVPHWLGRLIELACFAARIHRLQLDSSTTKIFLASRLTDEGPRIRADVDAIVNRRCPEWADVVFVDSSHAGFEFADELSPRIWISDSLMAVYSPRLAEPGSQHDWVSYEVSRAWNLGMPCRLFRTSSTPFSSVRERLAREDPRAAEQLVGRQVVTELPEAQGPRVAALEGIVPGVARRAAAEKCDALILGFLDNFFTPNQRWLIGRIHLLQLNTVADGGVTTADAARLLYRTARELESALQDISSKERCLSFPSSGIEVPPVWVDLDRHECGGNLLAAMEILRTDLLGQVDGQTRLRNDLVRLMRRIV